MTSEKDPVRIQELDIVRAPGFETGGFEIEEFSSGVNLIHGPNAAGKTTTADSITKILWPDAARDGENIVGLLSLNGEHWRVDVFNGRVEYQRNGQEATAPNLPSVDYRDRYRLSLHDLLQQETRNESFAETIQRESAGGYDLSAVHEELGYKKSPITRRKGVFQEANVAVETWRNKRNDAKGLEEERSRLTKLRSELEETKQARDEKEALNQAITYREAKSKHESTKAELDELPGILEQVDGNEFHRVKELENEIDEWREEKVEALEKEEEARGALETASLSDGGVSDGVLARLKRRRDSLEESESRKKRFTQKLEGAKRARSNACKDIPLDIEHDELVNLEPGTWADVSEFARKAARVQAERQRRDVLDQWTGNETDSESDLQTLERGSKALENWLMTGPEAGSAMGAEAAFRIGAVSAAVVSLTGLILGVLISPILFSVILIGVVLFVYGYRQRKNAEEFGGDREPHRNSFKQTNLASPSSWTEDDVRNRLIEIYDEVAKHKVADEWGQQRDALIAELDLDEKEEALAEKREELRKKVGAVPETEDIELAVIVRRVLDWQEKHDEVVDLQTELKEIEKSLKKARSTLQGELKEYGYDDVEDSATATQNIRDLEQRQNTHENATRDLSDAEKTIEKAEEKLNELESKQEEIYTTLSLELGERKELESLCERVDEYERITNEVRGAEAVVEQERKKLETLPAYDSELKEKELSELKQELRRAEEIADRYDGLQEQILEIESKIRNAKSENKVEEAITEKKRALTALEERLNEDYSAMVGDVLIEHVQEETVEASRPAVFQHANEVLVTITHGRYELDLAEDEQTFRAYDTVKQRGLSLEELSSGTRLQVLFSVRLAFVEQQEQRAKLPLILDETLANTDDSRAEVIIESMIELARDGRQIFYFTAQGDELAKWRSALKDASDVDWTMIDLGEVRDLDRTVKLTAIDSIESITPTPPDPAGHDHQSYAEVLDVGRFSPYNGAESIHLWYIVGDVEVLHDLLELQIKYWGQLKSLLERGKDELVQVEPETLGEIRQNAAALEEFVQAWKIGRGDPVDRSSLEASGAVSDTFIDQVTDLSEELAGDAEQLVEALYNGEVDRFRRNKAEELEEYLRDEGFLISREPLDDDTIKIRMIERLVEADFPRERAAERVSEILARISRGSRDD